MSDQSHDYERCLFQMNGEPFAADLLREGDEVFLLVDFDAKGNPISPAAKLRLDPLLLVEVSSAGPFHYQYLGEVESP